MGKSEVMKRLLTDPELNSQKLITTTTRSPRVGERDGQDYYFISREEFREGIAEANLSSLNNGLESCL